MLTGLFSAALADPGLTRARDLARSGAAQVDGLDITAPPALRPFAVAAVAADPDNGANSTNSTNGANSTNGTNSTNGANSTNGGNSTGGGAGRPVLAVTATSREADDLAAALGGLLPAEQVAVFPSWETLPHERLSPRSDTVGRRLAVLRRLAHPESADAYGRTGPLRVVVAPIRSLLQPQLKGLGDLDPVQLAAGDEADLEEVARRLIDMAYARVDLVTKRGEFAVRGGILDVFPPTDEHPSRVEFWGDEVEEIRTFAVADQRTIDQVPLLWAPPCRELLLTPPVRDRAAALAEQHPELAEILDKLAEGIPVEGMESLAPVLVGPDSLELLLDAMPAGTHVLLCDPERIRTRAHDLVRTSEEFLQASWAAAASAARRRWTSAPPRSARWARSAPPPASSASRGGRCPRSAWSRGDRRDAAALGGRAGAGRRPTGRRHRGDPGCPAGPALPRRDGTGGRRPQALGR
ncbi:hypothetical protein GCM10027614_38100 [Micromonospora vulcania]